MNSGAEEGSVYTSQRYRLGSLTIEAGRLEQDRYSKNAPKTERSDEFTRSPAVVDRYHVGKDRDHKFKHSRFDETAEAELEIVASMINDSINTCEVRSGAELPKSMTIDKD